MSRGLLAGLLFVILVVPAFLAPSAAIIAEPAMVQTTASPIALIYAATCAILLMTYPQIRKPVVRHPPASESTKAVAFCIDMIGFAILGIVPLAFLSLTIEYAHTGVWRWSFSRNFFRITDATEMAAFVLAWRGYYLLHYRLDRPTLGQYLLHLRRGPSDAAPYRSRLYRETCAAPG